MKLIQHLRAAMLTIMVALAIAACEKPPKGDNAQIGEKEQAVVPTGETFVVDTARSWIRFIGYGVGKNHPGIFKLNYGATAVMNDSISGGSFVINVKSMKMEQEGEHITGKLRPHLLSGDFFDAEKFGTASFEITNVVPYELSKDGEKSLIEGANFVISGNLKIKDVTKNVSFPARVEMDANKLKAEADFDIDRREWKMNYGNDKTLGDKFISEKVNIEFYIEAMKASETDEMI